MKLETHIKVFSQESVKFDDVLVSVTRGVELIKNTLKLIDAELDCIANLVIGSNVQLLSLEKGCEVDCYPFYDIWLDIYAESLSISEAKRDELVEKLKELLGDSFAVELQGEEF